MLTAVFLSTILMLGGLRGTAASDLRVHGNSISSDERLSSDDGRHTGRKQLHQQTKSEIRKSLDLESFNIHVTPTASKISHPNIIRLFPPTIKPLLKHANMPLRFGRDNFPDDDNSPNSTPNMPQRFGRAWKVFQMCAECPGVREALQPPAERNSLYWSLLRTLANTHSLNTGLHWGEGFDFSSSSENLEMQENTFTGRKKI